MLEFGDWAPDPGQVNLPLVPVDRPASVYVTSGSTGEPKGVVRDQRVMLHHAMTYSLDHAVVPGDRQSYLYSSQSGASMPDMFGALLNGAALCPWDPRAGGIRELAEWIDEQRITLLHLPIGLSRLLVHGLPPGKRFPSLRVMIASGEPAFQHDILAARQCVSEDCVLVHQLSATETNYMTRNLLYPGSPVPEGVVSVGAPARDKLIRLVDAQGHDVPEGGIGEIVVESAYLAAGYWHDPALTARKFSSIPGAPGVRRYATGDLGQWTDHGLRHLGRADEQVRVRGHRVELAEVEGSLLAWAAALQAAAVAQPDGQGGHRLVAYVVPADPHRPPTQDDMRAYLADRLPEHMLPSALVIMDELPWLATGKIDRRSLPQTRGDRPHLRTAFEEPRDVYEEKLQRIWQSVLGIRPIGVRDAFFDLGGSSLQAMRLISRVSGEFGERLPQASLLQTPTIEKQALMLRSERADRPTARIVGIQPEGRHMPLFCISPRVVDVLAYRTLALALGEDQPFYALYSVDMPPRPVSMSSIEHEAEIFVQDIQDAAPAGPLAIGGYSHGGIVAYEAARRLCALGRNVAVLVLMDVYGPAYRRMAPLLPQAAYRPLQSLRSLQRTLAELFPWFRYHLRSLGRLQWSDRWMYIGSKARNHLRWWGTRAGRAWRGLAGRARPRGQKASSVGKSFVDYQPGAYAGRTLILRAGKQPLGIRPDPKMGWGELLEGEVQVVEIPGFHDSILFGPRISILAHELRHHLDGLRPGEALNEGAQD